MAQGGAFRRCRARHHRTARTSLVLRKRRTLGESTDKTTRPAGTIHNPSTGKNHNAPPAKSAPPSTFRPVLVRGTLTLYFPTLMCDIDQLRLVQFCFQGTRRSDIGTPLPVRKVKAASLFLGSSVVEQPAVNRLVASSNLARGAILTSRCFIASSSDTHQRSRPHSRPAIIRQKH